VSQRHRNGNSLWIPAYRDLCGVSEDGGEVFFDPHFADQVLQEGGRPPQLRERLGQCLNPAETLLSPGGGHSTVIAGREVPALRV
jgi:hypothetical protein